MISGDHDVIEEPQAFSLRGDALPRSKELQAIAKG
jgi:hypothetical protein